MKSGQVIGGIVVGSVLGATMGYMIRPRNKTMAMMRKGLKMIQR